MKTKFEICEGCPITNKDDCVVVFGSKECAGTLVKLKKYRSKYSSMTFDYSKELFLRVNKLLLDCKIVKYNNTHVVNYDCTFEHKHGFKVITLWMHDEYMNLDYYFKHY